MAWNHPDDVPTSLTRRAYCLRGVPPLSQNQYAAVVADAYEDIKQEVLRDLGKVTESTVASETVWEELRILTRDNPDTIAAWVNGWRAGGARELVGWGIGNNVQYARPGDTIGRMANGTFHILRGSKQQ